MLKIPRHVRFLFCAAKCVWIVILLFCRAVSWLYANVSEEYAVSLFRLEVPEDGGSMFLRDARILSETTN